MGCERDAPRLTPTGHTNINRDLKISLHNTILASLSVPKNSQANVVLAIMPVCRIQMQNRRFCFFGVQRYVEGQKR